MHTPSFLPSALRCLVQRASASCGLLLVASTLCLLGACSCQRAVVRQAAPVTQPSRVVERNLGPSIERESRSQD